MDALDEGKIINLVHPNQRNPLRSEEIKRYKYVIFKLFHVALVLSNFSHSGGQRIMKLFIAR